MIFDDRILERGTALILSAESLHSSAKNFH